MKKLFILFAIIPLIAGPAYTSEAAGRKKVDSGKISALVAELRADARAEGVPSERESVRLPGIKVVSESNLDFVSIGGVGIGLMKMAGRFSGDDDAKMALATMDGLRKLMVLSYEDCSVSLKDRFNAKIMKTLNGCEKLMEAKDDGESISIFGTTSKDGSKISDIVMFAPEDCALICFFGTIDADKLGKLVEAAKD